MASNSPGSIDSAMHHVLPSEEKEKERERERERERGGERERS